MQKPKELRFSAAVLELALKVLILVAVGYILITRSIPTPDTVMLLVLLYVAASGKGRAFIKDWWFFFLYFYLYNLVRGHAHLIQKPLGISIHETELLSIEKFIFHGQIPTLRMQKFADVVVHWWDYAAIIMYLSYFIFPLSVGTYIWLKEPKKYFLQFRNAYMVLCLLGLITYILYPAAPPWMAAELGYLPHLTRNSWELVKVGQWTSNLFDSVGYNLVAPLPSLHVGWAFLSSIVTQQLLSRKGKPFWIAYLPYLYTIAMILTVVYTGDHYIVDGLLGIVYALLALFIVDRVSIKQIQSLHH